MILRNVVDLRSAAENAREARAGTTPGEVDLEGRFVVVGLWDRHVHFGQWAMASRRVDLAGAGSAAEAARLALDGAVAAPPVAGTVFLASGFRDALWPDAPSVEMLECGDLPVALLSGDVHTLWLNRAATRQLGLADDEWFLREQAAFDVTRRISVVPDEVLDGWARDAARAAAARGVVGIVDFEMEDAPGAWARRAAAGFDTLRVRAAVYPHTPPPPALDHPLVGLGPFKLFTDGSLNTRTAWCDHPYSGGDDVGVATYPPGGLLEAARAGADRGLAPAIHAIGDRAVAEALDVFEVLATEYPGLGGSIEHVQLIRDEDVARLAALGVVASVQPEHAMDDRDVADRYWAGRTGRAFALRALADAGATLALGSDAPVAPLDPWITIAAAVTRTRDGREPWHPEQALTVEEALAASASPHADDLVVLDADPRDPANLRDMPVFATMVAGRWTHGPFVE